ncbi:hypothetical protein EB008_03685 [bacterium]|nr:hypothetical protein [bacterium]
MVRVLHLALVCICLFLIGMKPRFREKGAVETIQAIGYTAAWIKNLVKEVPEIEWLADQKVHITQESVGLVSDYSPSYILYKKFYPEFDRTVLTLKSFEVFAKGNYRDYLFLTYKQDPQFRLKYATFRDMQKFFRSTFEKLEIKSEREIEKLMRCYILFSDLGKTKTARRLAAQKGIKEKNLDLFFSKIATFCPEIFPSYTSLDKKSRDILVRLGKQNHFGHIAHFEGGVELFEEIKRSDFLEDQVLMDLAFIGHICDVAGAQGHVEPCTSLNYNEKTHQLLLDVREACKNISLIGSSKAWDAFLEKRAKALEIGTEGNLNPIILRIGSMMRFTTPYEAHLLKKALFKLAPEELEGIHEAFSWENRVLVKYIPAVLLNLVNNSNLGQNLNERIEQTVILGLPFLAKSMNMEKALKCPHEALNFNPIAKIAKENPKELYNEGAMIDDKGIVTLQKKLG